jgi:hypothetical protein
MADEFDPIPYVRPPILDVASGVALGVALLSAAPKGAPEGVRKAARKVRKETLALQAAWGKSDASPAPPDKRKADMRIDNAWGILLDRLDSYASLPAADFPKAARAREICDAISPKDREWLKLPYGAEWAESDKRLKKIDAEGLAADIDTLAGPEFLVEVRRAHEAYGIAIGVTKAPEEAPPVNLADPLRALSRAVARYGLVIAAMVDEDAASVATARRALKPIDDHRDGQARRSAAGTRGEETPPPATPTTPVPEVP